MLTTKRYDYVQFEAIQTHPSIANHRPVNPEKVRHYKEDILKNGLLEPLVVWERNHNEFFLVGGFHRQSAIWMIRQEKPGYYDRVDVRVVAGDVEEMRALNLKLNADRLDAKITEYFDTVIFLNNANWEKSRIGSFLDKSETWIEEIIRFVPGMDPRIRAMLNEGKISWSKAKAVSKKILEAKPGTEKATADAVVKEIEGGGDAPAPRRVLSVKSATKRLSKHIEKNPKTTYSVTGEDLFALFALLGGQANGETQQYLERVREKFPGLVD
jgi:ParB-like chromosome segregation protein Spo0J